jgi:riboflavin synthase
MFTGIIEAVGEVRSLRKEGGNLHLTVASPFASELKIDQSVAHNGVCLTVIHIDNDLHTVTAIDETLNKTNLGDLKPGDPVNLERCVKVGGRLDGHIVQGHADVLGKVVSVEERDGSWAYRISHPVGPEFLTVKKGSITINGVSLTVVDSTDGEFSVAIIPYTYEHTNFKHLKPESPVNLEFDIVGKYVARMMGK